MSYNLVASSIRRREYERKMVMPTPLRTEAIFRAAQERIKQYIVDNALGPGDSLPTEFDLSRRLGISRNSLREALKALETVGVVETRHGLGSFVGRASLAPLIAGMAFNLVQSINQDTRTLRELLELREILEVELVRRATGHYMPEQLARLEALVAAMETSAAENVANPEADRAFHQALYEPLDNQVVTLLLRTFWDIYAAVESQLPAASHTLEANARWHRAILEAIRRADADAAVAAMEEQFTGARNRLAAVGGNTSPPGPLSIPSAAALGMERG
jgi:DNA-binding FadR family transcriptional regulator